ncbi:MAG TPA: flagellar basal body rod protein FlgB [Silvibacterium sp.]|jgi:flagellar basal-body rod protein FlgB|nr:flagellar basal body rod protein FlgB [Silvibacterium sp.]
MHITTLLSDELGKYLNMSALELKLTAQNMANIDTPGYRTVGFDFAEEMERSMGESLASRKRDLDAKSLDTKPGSVASVRLVDGLIERPDGNNVSMDREGMKMAEAQLQFRMGIELLKSEFSTVLDAIHVDTK